MAEIFDSEEEEVSEVESFVLTEDLEGEAKDLFPIDSETRALLQAAGFSLAELAAGLHLSDEPHEVDPESRARLEKLLEAAGLDNIEPEILSRLTSSVSCALDEAAAALTRMRFEKHLEKHHPSSSNQTKGVETKQRTSSSPSSNSGSTKPASSSPASCLHPLEGRPPIVEDLDSDACCSLIDACNEGDLEAVRRLLEEGRNVNEVTEEGESLLSLACSSGYLELAQLLLATTRANVEDRGLRDMTPLMEAASAGHFDVVRLLLDHGADVNAQTAQGNTPLMYAAAGCSSDHECVVRQLLDAGANVSDCNENGHTPLMEAASAGNVEVARILVDHGASINTHSNEFKESALTLACYKGHLEMVRFLLEAGADQEHKTEEMHTALMEASMDGHVEVAKLLLDSGAQVNMPADSFESPLTLAACGGHVELAMLLLERGANIEEVNDEGYTPLMEAAREGHEEMVGLLLSQGADINAQTEETQETALTLACCGGFLEVADFLIKAGADIEAGANTPLAEAAQEGHINLVQHLLEAGANVNATSASGDTPLMYASENGHTEVAEVLLEAGACLEQEADGGRTALMKAARAGHLSTVKFLVSAGANINKVTSNNDHTPLSLACHGGHAAVVEYLLSQGADSTHRLKDNSTMLIEAAKGGHTQIVQLLIEHPLPRSSPSPLESSQLPSSKVLSCMNPVENASGRGEAIVASNSDIVENSTPSVKKTSSATTSGNKTAVKTTTTTSSRKSSKSSTTDADDTSKVSKTTCITKSTSSDSSQSLGQVTGVDTEKALKETERLEQCINSMMKRTEMLNPSREEQILQKQQILEELQRVEKELHTKTQAQLLLSAQASAHQQQQQIIQALTSAAGDVSALAAAGDQSSDRWSSMTREEAAALWALTADPESKAEVTPGDPTVASTGVTGKKIAKAKKKLKPTTEVTETEAKLNQKNIQHDSQSSQPSIDSIPPPAASSSSVDSSQQTSQSTQTVPVALQADGSAVITTSGPGLLSSDHRSTIKLNLVSGQATVSTTKTSSGSAAGHPVTTGTMTLPTLSSKQLQTLKEQLAAAAAAAAAGQGVDGSVTTRSFTARSLMSGAASGSSSFPVSLSLSATLTTSSKEASSVDASDASKGEALPLTDQKSLDQKRRRPLPTSVASQTVMDGNLLDGLGQKKATSSASSTSSSKSSCSVNNNQVCSSSSSSSVVSGSNNTCSNTTSSSVPSPPPFFSHSIEIDGQTDSNHDTALTLSCSGGHEELVSLLLSRGANCEHRDKKGFTPLMLAATQGHANICEILLNHGVDIEAQSERTKDTALSLACSSGRYEVVELLLSRGANKEHRNVSDYTPLSLAASGGYVNIIKLLLNHGAEINSRTGSKLGISPLMLAAMNGHASTVKLLLDMGSDINAQIETNRNTALTLACFQGRCEVVSLLLDRKANVEHRAKTGLTPLMEAASGGYVEVGRILLEKGADVNAPPVPSSRDTALTIAADKGHYRFVEMLIKKGGSLLNLDARNKKGSSPLWLAANGGHLDVVQLLVNSGADIDAQDNRKVSCLLAAFRKGHLKVVKWMVKYVSQYPSDQEMTRYLALVADKDLLKKCNQCMEVIRQAKDRQAAEANKNAIILLEELEQEKSLMEKKKETLAKRKQKQKQKKKAKPVDSKSGKSKESGKDQQKGKKSKESSDSESESDESDDDDDSLNIPAPDSAHEPTPPRLPVIVVPVHVTPASPARKQSRQEPSPVKETVKPVAQKKAPAPAVQITVVPAEQPGQPSRSNKSTKNVKKENQPPVQPEVTIEPVSIPSNIKKNKDQKTVQQQEVPEAKKTVKAAVTITKVEPKVQPQTTVKANETKSKPTTKTSTSVEVVDSSLHWTNESHVANGLEVQKKREKARVPSPPPAAPLGSNKQNKSQGSNKQQRHQQQGGQLPIQEDLEWKEVRSGRQKRITVPSTAISRVIGRGGCNINAVREYSGAHIDVEKQKGQQADRLIVIKGSADATKNAHAMINSLVNEPEKDLMEIIAELGLEEPAEREEEVVPVQKTKASSSKSSSGKSNATQPQLASMVFSSSQLTSSASSFTTSTKPSKSVSTTTTVPFASTWTGPTTTAAKTTKITSTPSGSPSKTVTNSSPETKPVVSSPFASVRSSSQPFPSKSPNPSSSGSEYTPFTNTLFGTVGVGVWGAKDQKLNFATVAARGTSVFTSSSGSTGSPSPAPSNTVTSTAATTTTLSLQPGMTVKELEATPVIEPSKAPGFRGNFVSPSSSASPSNVTNTTPGSFQSSGSAPSSPPPMSCVPSASVQSDIFLQSMGQQRVVSPPRSEASKASGFSLAPGSRKTSSMGLSPPSSRDASEQLLQQQESMDQFRSDLMQTSPNSRDANVQSSLNPNAQSYAPEVIASMTASQRERVIGRPNTTPVVSRASVSQEVSPRGSSVPVPFESLPNPQLQLQMRAAILAAGASLQMQTLQAQQQAAQAQRFQQQQQQQAAAAALMGAPDFNPPSAETLRMLQTALQGAAAVAATGGPSPTAFQSTPGINPNTFHSQAAHMSSMQATSGQMQPNPIGSMSRGRKLSDLTGDPSGGHGQLMPGVMDESKSLPRPIGTERAQRTKNPPGVMGSLTGSPFGFTGPGIGNNPGNDLWPMDMNHAASGSEADWLNAQFSAPSDPLVSNLLQSSLSNRTFDGGFVDPVMDQSFQFPMDQAYHGNAAAGLMPQFLNGGIPSMAGHPAHSSHALGAAMTTPQMTYLPHQPSADDYWSGKIPGPGLPNGLEASIDHKNMSWQTSHASQHHPSSWSHQQHQN